MNVKKTELATKLHKLQKYTKHCLVTIAQFRMLFPEYQDSVLKVRLSQLTTSGVLEKICRGVWSFPESEYYATTDLRYLPHLLRRTDINYISLESVLSKHSVISQQMFDYLTVMTTGRSGTFQTPMGTLELVHTKKQPLLLLADTAAVENVPIREALIERAYKDLKKVGRNLDLIDMGELQEAINAQSTRLHTINRNVKTSLDNEV
jgi:predicted transcriptional regulator of viral defense system